MEVRGRGVSPNGTMAMANTFDKVQDGAFKALVGTRPGTFATRADVRVRNNQTYIKTERVWHAP